MFRMGYRRVDRIGTEAVPEAKHIDILSLASGERVVPSTPSSVISSSLPAIIVSAYALPMIR